MSTVDNRWLPPSPHREVVLEWVEKGRAHIEERGHNTPPLLVFEDGGVMELPLVRYTPGEGHNFSPADASQATGQTQFSDVCGSMDEFKKLLETEPQLVRSGPARLLRLVEDACYMISRMARRRESYREFSSRVRALCERMEENEGPDVEKAHEAAGAVRASLRAEPRETTAEITELCRLGEEIRRVAGELESVLSAHKKAAIEVGELHSQIKGGRNWERQD